MTQIQSDRADPSNVQQSCLPDCPTNTVALQTGTITSRSGFSGTVKCPLSAYAIPKPAILLPTLFATPPSKAHSLPTNKKGPSLSRRPLLSSPLNRDDVSQAIYSALDWRLTAAYLPRRSTSSSKSSRSPSFRAAIPARSTALMCTKASGWPSSR
jgi:hypothetical protein